VVPPGLIVWWVSIHENSTPRKKTRKNTKPDELSMEQESFVQKLIELEENITATARVTGIPLSTAKAWAKKPIVLETIAKAKKILRDKLGYTLEAAMEECEKACEFARDTDNANALMKGIELKTKLNGLLIEKHDHRMAANFSIQIQGVRDKPIPIIASPMDDAGIKRLVEGVAESVAGNETTEMTAEEAELF